MLSTYNMLKTTPVERQTKWNDSDLHYKIRVFAGYHLTEINVQTHRLELTLRRGTEVLKTSFMHPVPLDGDRSTISRSRHGEEERIQIKSKRASFTRLGYYPITASVKALASRAG